MAGLVPFKRIHSTNQEIQLLQSALADTLQSITSHPLLGGQLIPGVPVKAGANTISHGLGRNYVSWAWMNPNAFMSLAYGKSPDPSKFLVVNASVPGVVDIYVF